MLRASIKWSRCEAGILWLRFVFSGFRGLRRPARSVVRLRASKSKDSRQLGPIQGFSEAVLEPWLSYSAHGTCITSVSLLLSCNPFRCPRVKPEPATCPASPDPPKQEDTDFEPRVTGGCQSSPSSFPAAPHFCHKPEVPNRERTRAAGLLLGLPRAMHQNNKENHSIASIPAWRQALKILGSIRVGVWGMWNLAWEASRRRECAVNRLVRNMTVRTPQAILAKSHGFHAETAGVLDNTPRLGANRPV